MFFCKSYRVFAFTASGGANDNVNCLVLLGLHVNIRKYDTMIITIVSKINKYIMKNKFIVPAIIVIVLVIGAGFLVARRGAEHPLETGSEQVLLNPYKPTATPTSTPSTVQTPTPTPTEKTSEGQFSGGDTVENVDVQVFEVVYDGEGFSPNSLKVKQGDVVIFNNKSDGPFWPASAPHPAHTDYPEFDAQKKISSGQTFEFKFTKSGTWKYHDHLNSSAFGTVTVQ